MTQASLSPELPGALGASPTAHDGAARTSAPSEGALWLIALTSSALVVAAVLLLALLLNSVVTDASLGGFVAGIGIVIAAVGLGGVTYSLVTARRAGYLVDPASAAVAASVAPAGMHVVPAVPPDLGRRKRQQLEAERSARSRQAKAIAAAAVATPKPRQVAPSAQRSRTAPSARPVPRPARQHPARSAPVAARPLSAGATRPAPAAARSTPATSTVPAHANAAPARSQAPSRPQRAATSVRPPITMPQAQLRQPRPAAWPQRAPVVRMAAPPMRPRTQAAAFQVNASNVRFTAPIQSRR